jgi:hypothetical protein
MSCPASAGQASRNTSTEGWAMVMCRLCISSHGGMPRGRSIRGPSLVLFGGHYWRTATVCRTRSLGVHHQRLSPVQGRAHQMDFKAPFTAAPPAHQAHRRPCLMDDAASDPGARYPLRRCSCILAARAPTFRDRTP